MSKRANFFAIGVFVSVAAFLALAALIIFGSGTLNKDTFTLMATFRGSANGLREGAKVKAYGVEVGAVENVLLHRDDDTGEILIPVIFELDMGLVQDLLGVEIDRDEYQEQFQGLLEEGIKAELRMSSMVTGLLYVQLEFDKGVDGFVLKEERFESYISIPTVSTDMEIAMESLLSLANNIGTADVSGLFEGLTDAVEKAREAIEAIEFDRLSNNANEFLVETRKTFNSPSLRKGIDDLGKALSSVEEITDKVNGESQQTLRSFNEVMEKLKLLIEETDRLAVNANQWLDPEGPVYYEATNTLEEVSESARSLKVFFEYLERNPNALLTGKGKELSK